MIFIKFTEEKVQLLGPTGNKLRQVHQHEWLFGGTAPVHFENV